MAEPWEAAPIVQPRSAGAAPWEAAPIVSRSADPYARQRAEGVPVPELPGTPRPATPTLRDRVVGAIQGAADVGNEVVHSLGGLIGGGAGALGGALGAISTAITGGVQPDSDAVRAVTGPGPGTKQLGGQVVRPPDAIDEAAQQGADQVSGALDTAARLTAPLNPMQGALQQAATPGSADVASSVRSGIGEAMSRMDPGLVIPGMSAARTPANGAARGGVVDQALNAGAQAVQATKQAAGKAGAAVRGAVPAGVAKTLGAPDPELARIAQLADQFPHRMEIPPDRLLPEGAPKAVGQELGDLPLSGGAKRDTANRQAITRNTIDQLVPGSMETRLNAKTLDASISHNGEIIGQGYRDAGAVPAAEVQARLDTLAERARQHGSDELGRIITNRAQEILGKADEAGNIPGETLREWDSDVGRQARMTNDEELASHLSDLQDVARDAAMSRLSPEQAQGVTDARRRYAYGILLGPSVAKAGKESSAIGLDGLVRPGKLISVVTSTRAGTDFVARNRGGPLADLARVGQLIDNTTKAKATGLTAATRNTVGAAVGATAGRAYNKAAPGATERMLPARKTPEPPAPPAELELAPPDEPLGPGGGGAPAEPGPLGDLTPEWETTPGAGGAPRDGVDAAGLYPAIGEETAPVLPQGAGPGREIPAVPGRPGEADAAPLGDVTPDWGTTPGAGGAARGGLDAAGLSPVLGEHGPSTGSRRGGRLDVPAVSGRPDLPDTMVANREGQVFADQPTAPDQVDVKPSIASLESPGARAARESQTGAAREGEAAKARAAAEKEAAKPKPNEDEQRRLGEIDAALAQTNSDIVRETLTKAREKIERETTARDTVEKAKAAATELRTAAMTMTDTATREALIARADKLDPPPKVPAGEVTEGQPEIPGSAPPAKPLPTGKATEGQPELAAAGAPKPLPVGRVQYLDDPAWRKQHGLGGEDATAAVRMREAFDFDPEAVAAAAQKHDTNPKALDAAIAKILEKRDADQGNGAAGGGASTAGEAGKPGGDAATERPQPGADGAAAPGSGGKGDQQDRQAAADPVVEAADRARFDVAHPRAHDGKFVERPAGPRNLMGEWRTARDQFLDALKRGDHAEASRHEAAMNDIANEIRNSDKNP